MLSITRNLVSKTEDLPEGTPRTEISKAMTDLYLMVSSDPENPVLPIRISPIDISAGKLKLGETLWVNLTTHQIKGELGDVSLTVQPDQQIVSKPPLSSSGYYKAKLTYQPEGADKFLPLMEKSWWFNASVRNLGFITNSENGLPQIFTFRDHRTASQP